MSVTAGAFAEMLHFVPLHRRQSARLHVAERKPFELLGFSGAPRGRKSKTIFPIRAKVLHNADEVTTTQHTSN
eukprot:11186095-Lingulodinium_polyedra.AAC.1